MTTVKQVLDRARFHLADDLVPDGEEFTDSRLQQAYESAYETMYAAARAYSLPQVENSAVITVQPGTKIINPYDEGVHDFGTPYLVEERDPGSQERGTEVISVPRLVPAPPGDRLGQYEFKRGVIYTNGSVRPREVVIEYYATSVPPSSGSIGIPECLSYLALKTAALALESREEGMALSTRLEERAASALDLWLTSQVKQMQTSRFQRPRFGSRRH